MRWARKIEMVALGKSEDIHGITNDSDREDDDGKGIASVQRVATEQIRDRLPPVL